MFKRQKVCSWFWGLASKGEGTFRRWIRRIKWFTGRTVKWWLWFTVYWFNWSRSRSILQDVGDSHQSRYHQKFYRPILTRFLCICSFHRVWTIFKSFSKLINLNRKNWLFRCNDFRMWDLKRSIEGIKILEARLGILSFIRSQILDLILTYPPFSSPWVFSNSRKPILNSPLWYWFHSEAA